MKDLFFLFASDITSHIYSNPVHIVLGGVYDRSSLTCSPFSFCWLARLSRSVTRSYFKYCSRVMNNICLFHLILLHAFHYTFLAYRILDFIHTHKLTTYSPASGTSNIMNEQFKCEIFHFEQFNHCWVACTITTFRS